MIRWGRRNKIEGPTKVGWKEMRYAWTVLATIVATCFLIMLLFDADYMVDMRALKNTAAYAVAPGGGVCRAVPDEGGGLEVYHSSKEVRFYFYVKDGNWLVWGPTVVVVPQHSFNWAGLSTG